MIKDTGLVRFEEFLWFFLFANPFLDIINGVYLNVVTQIGVLDVETTTTGVTPTLVIRMLMLVVFAGYLILIKDRRAIAMGAALGLTFAVSVASEYFYTGRWSLFLDAQYMARFCYNIAALMVYVRVFAASFEEKDELYGRLNRVVTFTILVFALCILLSAALGIGYSTYADRLGYRGNRGFFYAGNDITAALVLLMPVALAKVMSLSRREIGTKKYLLLACVPAMALDALVMIGSKTAFLSVAGVIVTLFAAGLSGKKRTGDSREVAGVLWVLASAAVIFAVIILISSANVLQNLASSFLATSEIAHAEGLGSAMFSGRLSKLFKQFTEYGSGGALVWLFGMGRGSQEFVIEMDLAEVLFYYGVLGCFTMLGLYLAAGIRLLSAAFRRRDTMSIALVVAIGLVTGYMVMAGHVLFSVTSGFYYMFAFAYSRAYLAEGRKDVPFWEIKRI